MCVHQSFDRGFEDSAPATLPRGAAAGTKEGTRNREGDATLITQNGSQKELNALVLLCRRGRSSLFLKRFLFAPQEGISVRWPLTSLVYKTTVSDTADMRWWVAAAWTLAKVPRVNRGRHAETDLDG